MGTQDASWIEDCPFCLIVNNQADTEILLSVSTRLFLHVQEVNSVNSCLCLCVSVQDDELLCFRDMKPGAIHHYLVIPRTHIDNCKCLQGDHIPLVERMIEMATSVLEKNKVGDLSDVRMGFHIPPFSSVPHLHLHALAPASKMNFKAQLHYGPQSHWFITVDKVLSQLRTRGKVR
ncbi:adenosine 5'-monophosphoramidase HINT3-like isoform X1 [Epinephelus lanceolatus]